MKIFGKNMRDSRFFYFQNRRLEGLESYTGNRKVVTITTGKGVIASFTIVIFCRRFVVFRQTSARVTQLLALNKNYRNAVH
jgi:hypothetical protein